MKPNDQHTALAPQKRPLRVLLVAGSDRRQYNCPGVDSKARALMLRLADRLPPEWEIDVEDLGNVYGRARIQSCNACVSTSMALCVWPCNCYEAGDKNEPDLMWDLDLYARLDLADAWAFVAPVNWYAPTSNLKLMFDRLVCANGGNPREDLIDHKNPEKAMVLERTGAWREELSLNHLEGRTAAFFCYGDDAAEERDRDGRPRYLRHPDWFDPAAEPMRDGLRDAYAPLVWQCRFSGIEVPDPLWTYQDFGKGRIYADNQAEQLPSEPGFFDAFDAWADRLAAHVSVKGRVAPGKYRAFGYQAPSHRWADAKLKWRELRLNAGLPPAGSSPAAQQAAGLNRDATFSPKRSEASRHGDAADRAL
ncbi:MAG: flavodoxin family protein [Methylibium sp.]|uniref:NAD(P)H-dependent oxidoreductase n=1 Tax=Methylibium sp. TaxID=2067992 RepID=UPI0017F9468F|nr:NAD(P)H-dependent oxidoreductase [Methylibium sp.]MBA3595762.1 flavodoxin family protein [Methylibium sp.]